MLCLEMFLKVFCVCVFLKILFILLLERGEGKEKERERLETWPATQACALTGNQTSDPLVCRLALSPLSHTSEGLKLFNLYSFMDIIIKMKNTKPICLKDYYLLDV